ncbi:MAG: hypothetical protein ACOVQK_11575 [Cyanobium sp.]|jgi:hypothetical protein
MQPSQGSTVAIATKSALFLAGLLGAALPLAGWAAIPDVCLLAPSLEAGSPPPPPAIPKAQTPLSRPTLFVREPLAELRIEQGSRVLWSWRSLAGEALEGPLAWPLPPLKPRQAFTIRLRPVGATADHYASIQLVGAGPGRLREGDGLLQSLQGRPQAWLPAIDGLLAKGDRSLATALLFAHEGPNEPELNALRLVVAQQSCP